MSTEQHLISSQIKCINQQTAIVVAKRLKCGRKCFYKLYKKKKEKEPTQPIMAQTTNLAISPLANFTHGIAGSTTQGRQQLIGAKNSQRVYVFRCPLFEGGSSVEKDCTVVREDTYFRWFLTVHELCVSFFQEIYGSIKNIFKVFVWSPFYWFSQRVPQFGKLCKGHC